MGLQEPPGLLPGKRHEYAFPMIKVKTFTSELKPFFAMRQLESLDEQVNSFLQAGRIPRVVSVSDACTATESGATIGIIRVLAYESA